MNAMSGNIERAIELFEEIPRRDMVCYCSLIQGLSMRGRGSEAILLFNRMLQEGIIPDEVAFNVVLTACSRMALINDGWHYFQMMKDEYSIVVPSPDHYACMVDHLSRSGRLRLAYKLLENMAVQPHAIAWGALLGGCRLHGETELAEVVSHRLFKLVPRNAGNYVLMSNIYAVVDLWVDVSHVRDRMNERGVKKVQGCSWLSSRLYSLCHASVDTERSLFPSESLLQSRCDKLQARRAFCDVAIDSSQFKLQGSLNIQLSMYFKTIACVNRQPLVHNDQHARSTIYCAVKLK